MHVQALAMITITVIKIIAVAGQKLVKTMLFK